MFRNRNHAGQELARMVLQQQIATEETLVLALPRGGVPVAYEIAKALNTELDVFLVRKLGLPGEEELAIGAIASGGVRVLNLELIKFLHLPGEVIERVASEEQMELLRREQFYREGRGPIPVSGRAVIVVDDGLATGASMLAAVRALRPQGVKRITIAVPVGSRQTCEELKNEADEILCAETPEPFGAVGAWYEDFSQLTDDEVRRLLDNRARRRSRQDPACGVEAAAGGVFKGPEKRF